MRCKGCEHCKKVPKGEFIERPFHYCELGFDLLSKSSKAPITAAWELCKGKRREPKQ